MKSSTPERINYPLSIYCRKSNISQLDDIRDFSLHRGQVLFIINMLLMNSYQPIRTRGIKPVILEPILKNSPFLGRKPYQNTPWNVDPEIFLRPKEKMVDALLETMDLGPLIQRADNFIQWINPYPVDTIYSLSNQN